MAPDGNSEDVSTPVVPTATFRATLDLFQVGIDLMRQNLRRRHPSANDAQIGALLQEWLRHRPGAESGDSSGRPVDLTTRRA